MRTSIYCLTLGLAATAIAWTSDEDTAYENAGCENKCHINIPNMYDPHYYSCMADCTSHTDGADKPLLIAKRSTTFQATVPSDAQWLTFSDPDDSPDDNRVRRDVATAADTVPCTDMRRHEIPRPTDVESNNKRQATTVIVLPRNTATMPTMAATSLSSLAQESEHGQCSHMQHQQDDTTSEDDVTSDGGSRYWLMDGEEGSEAEESSASTTSITYFALAATLLIAGALV